MTYVYWVMTNIESEDIYSWEFLRSSLGVFVQFNLYTTMSRRRLTNTR